jgi:hypothetical protein
MSNTNRLEAVINNAIVNGNRIMEGGLGTIFCDKEPAAARKARLRNEKEVRQHGQNTLGRYARRVEDGEVRYYDGANRYAIVNSSKRVLWLEKRNSGWYAAR